MCFDLPRKTYGLPDGSTPISKVSRVQRRAERAKKKAEEDAQIVDAVQASKPKRKAIGARLRNLVLERDGFKCVRCGATAESGATLHVDHIESVAAGGTNCDTNLRTLCSECNLGRGARAEPFADPKNERTPEQLSAAFEWREQKEKEIQGVVEVVKKEKGRVK